MYLSEMYPWVDITPHLYLGVVFALICASLLFLGSALVCAGAYWRELRWADIDRACDYQDAADFIRETERLETELLGHGLRGSVVRELLRSRYELPGGGKAQPDDTVGAGVWVGLS